MHHVAQHYIIISKEEKHVIEQVNAHIKRFKILGIGRTLNIFEVRHLPAYVKIAAGKSL